MLVFVLPLLSSCPCLDLCLQVKTKHSDVCSFYMVLNYFIVLVLWGCVVKVFDSHEVCPEGASIKDPCPKDHLKEIMINNLNTTTKENTFVDNAAQIRQTDKPINYLETTLSHTHVEPLSQFWSFQKWKDLLRQPAESSRNFADLIKWGLLVRFFDILILLETSETNPSFLSKCFLCLLGFCREKFSLMIHFSRSQF